MLIEKVSVENFGRFVGKHELEFSTNDKKKLNVILGLNGSGKTQLFNAMAWCLYGIKGIQFYEVLNVEPLFLSDSIANNLANSQTATTKVKMNLIYDDKRYEAKVEVIFKKIDGKIIVDSKKTKYNKYLDYIFSYPPLIFVNNIGHVIEKFNQQKINSEKLDKIISKMNKINQKSQFEYFANSKFQNIDNKIQLVGDVDPIEYQALGRKATLDFMFLVSVRDILFPNSVLIVDSPFVYVQSEFIIPIYKFLIEHIPQIIFLKTHLHNQDFELKQGIVYKLVRDQETFSTTIKRLDTYKDLESKF